MYMIIKNINYILFTNQDYKLFLTIVKIIKLIDYYQSNTLNSKP